MQVMPNVGFVRKEVVAKLPKWTLVDDCVEGSVKAKGDTYLPKPEASTDAVKNDEQYKKYLLRAVFFPATGRTLGDLVGQVFSKPITHTLTTYLGPLVNDIDGAGTTLEQQSKQSLSSVLKHGRAGLLSDYPTTEGGKEVTKFDTESGRIRPRVIMYRAQAIINWREQVIGGETQLSLLVLHEMKDISTDEFEIECEPRWRVYQLNEAGGVEVTVWKQKGESKGGAAAGAIGSEDYETETGPIALMGSNGQPLAQIPFAFIGSMNNDSVVDEPPLYPLGVLNIAHYRNSADYEQSLFIVGQPTPVFSGLNDEWVSKHIKGKVKIGSQNAVALPPGGKAELLQANANTMPMEGMQHKEDQMKAVGAKLIEPNTVQRTATEAEIEETSEASVLSSIAKNVSAAYRLALYYCSLFGEEAELDKLELELNSEFQVMGLSAPERKEVREAWAAGLVTFDEAREQYRRKGIVFEDDDVAFAKFEAGTVENIAGE